MNSIRRKPEVLVGLMIALIALFLVVALLTTKNYSLPYVPNY